MARLRTGLLPALTATAVLLGAVLPACGNRTPGVAEPEPDVVEPAPEPEPTLDCDRIAAGYVPCLPGSPALAPDLAVTPPTPWISLPCVAQTRPGASVPRIDLFTDGHSPQDMELLSELLALEKAQPGGVCLHLHAFGGGDAPPPVLDLFEQLQGNPADAWTRLLGFVAGKRYLRLAEPDLVGPPAPPDPALIRLLTEADARSRRFGVRRSGLFLLDGRWVAVGLGVAPARARAVTASAAPPATQLTWTDREPDAEGRIREFSLLCRTRQDWKHRLGVISSCLDKKACPAMLSCISGRLYEQEWSESETLEGAADPASAMISAGDGPVKIFAWLDPDCAHSRELFRTLQALQQRDPRVRIHLDLIAGTAKAAAVRQTLLEPALTGNPGDALCVLSRIFSYYALLDAGDIPGMAAACGIAPPVLQNDPKSLKLPAGTLPAFCPAGVTPCLLVGSHLLEGVPSSIFLDYGISREARDLAGSKP